MDVPEVLEVQVVPSDEVRMVPPVPTTTNNPLAVVVLLSSLLHETIEILKMVMRIICKMFFNFSSYAKMISMKVSQVTH